MDVGWPSFLHLCIFRACRCITTALFPVAVVCARAMERSDSITSNHPMIPVHCLLLRCCHARPPTQCIVRIISQLRSLQLAMLPARSELSAIRESSLLNCALCPQSSCHSNSEFLKLGHSSSWQDFPGTSCDWHPLTPFQQTQSDRAHAVTPVLDLRDDFRDSSDLILRIHLHISWNI